jgi:hypothetical protein
MAWEVKQSRATEEALRSLLDKRDDSLMDSEDFLREFFRCMGGPKKLARFAADMMQSGDASNEIKRRMFDTIMSIWKFVEQRSGPPADLSVASEQELNAIIAEALGVKEEAA